MDYIFPVTMGFTVLILIGLGVLVKHYKAYWLISGYNTMSKEKKKNVDIEGLAKFTGNMCFAIGIVMILGTAAISLSQEILGTIIFTAFFPLTVYMIIKAQKYTRLVTVNPDGSEMYNLSDDDMTSHCCWKNDEEILAYAHKKNGGDGYYLMKDKTQEHIKLWSDLLISDGHPSYSPDGAYIITDTYPDRQRVANIYCIDAKNNEINTIAKVFAPFKYDNDVRCDLHPRWNHRGDKICFDSVFEGNRQLYIVHNVTLKN